MGILLRGIGYFAVVFAAGFALGIIRALWVAPQLGEANAIYLELPLMLLISLLAARVVVGKPPRPNVRSSALMGGVALVLLMGAEAFVGLQLRNLDWEAHWCRFATGPGAASLASYLLFGLWPCLLALRQSRKVR